MNRDDCLIHEFRTEHGKHGVRITHVPTGVHIEGNCGWMGKVPEVKELL
jgi:hypothetical protein